MYVPWQAQQGPCHCAGFQDRGKMNGSFLECLYPLDSYKSLQHHLKLSTKHCWRALIICMCLLVFFSIIFNQHYLQKGRQKNKEFCTCHLSHMNQTAESAGIHSNIMCLHSAYSAVCSMSTPLLLLCHHFCRQWEVPLSSFQRSSPHHYTAGPHCCIAGVAGL